MGEECRPRAAGNLRQVRVEPRLTTADEAADALASPRPGLLPLTAKRFG
jgi:hypothetical protein